MRPFLFLLLFPFLAPAQVTKYVALSGSDANPGTRAQPYLTGAKALAMMTGNRKDSILFRSGDVFPVSSYIGTARKKLFVGTYDGSAKAVLTGFTNVAPGSLLNAGNNGWYYYDNAAFSTFHNVASLDGRPLKFARVPAHRTTNSSIWYARAYSSSSPYSEIHGVGTGYIVDTLLTGSENYVGAYMVARIINWSIGRVRIWKQVGDTLFYQTLVGQKGNFAYPPKQGWGYFIENNLSSRTAFTPNFGDTYWDSTNKRIYVYLANENPLNHSFKVAFKNTGYNCDADSVKFANLHFTGYNQNCVRGGGSYLTFQDCEFSFSGESAIYAVQKPGWEFYNPYFHHNLTDGIKALRSIEGSSGCINWKVVGGVFNWHGLFEGMLYSGDPEGDPIVIEGDNTYVGFARIDSSGYAGIHTSGNGLLIENNLVRWFGLLFGDVAGYYNFWARGTRRHSTARSIVRYNIILYGRGNSQGVFPGTQYPVLPYDQSNANGKCAGVYLDENSEYFDVYGNVCGHGSWAGFMLNGAHKNYFHNNFVFEYWRGYEVVDFDPDPANASDSNRIVSNTFSINAYTAVFAPAPQNLFGLLLNYQNRTPGTILYSDSNDYHCFGAITTNLFAVQLLASFTPKTVAQWKAYSTGWDVNCTFTGGHTTHALFINPFSGEPIDPGWAGWKKRDGTPLTGMLSGYSGAIGWDYTTPPPPVQTTTKYYVIEIDGRTYYQATPQGKLIVLEQ